MGHHWLAPDNVHGVRLGEGWRLLRGDHALPQVLYLHAASCLWAT